MEWRPVRLLVLVFRLLGVGLSLMLVQLAEVDWAQVVELVAQGVVLTCLQIVVCVFLVFAF